MKILRTDNGREYINASLKNYLKKHEIVHQTTNAYTPEQNEMAERADRSIVEHARCMFHMIQLLKGFWAEAVATAVVTSPRMKQVLARSRIGPMFGFSEHVPWSSFQNKNARSGTGFNEDTKGYRLYNLKSKTITISREVNFINEG